MSEPKIWSIQLAGGNAGPFSVQEVEAMLRVGTVGRASLVWQRGMTDWIPLSEAQGLRHLLTAPPAVGASNSGLTSDYQWFVVLDECPLGPFSAPEMAAMIREGLIATDTLSWAPGRSGWEHIERALPNYCPSST